MPSKTEKSALPAALAKNKLLSAVLSLIVGLALGTTFGRDLLGAAGIPESCVRTIERASRAIDTGQAVADDGQAAFAAVKDLEIGLAADLLRDARDGAETLLDLAQRFNEARTTCNEERK